MKKNRHQKPGNAFIPGGFYLGCGLCGPERKAKDYSVEPFTFNAVRNVIGGLTLTALHFFPGQERTEREENRGEPEDSAHWRNPLRTLFSVSPATSSRSESTIPPSERPVLSRPCTLCWCQSWESFLKRTSGHKGLDQRVSGGRLVFIFSA